MKTDFLFRRRTRQATTIVLLLFAVATMWAAQMPALQFWAAQAQWIALAYLLTGMVLLVFRRTRLMFVCLGCSAAICLFFNEIQAPGAKHPACAKPAEMELYDSSNHEFTSPHQ
jgi:hypothetical protein